MRPFIIKRYSGTRFDFVGVKVDFYVIATLCVVHGTERSEVAIMLWPELLVADCMSEFKPSSVMVKFFVEEGCLR
jgi:hypothetical protein